MSWVEINGAVMRYQRSGKGRRPIVLVHEMGGTLESWDYMVPLLEDDFDVIRHDVRGSGLSEWTNGTQSIATLSADIAGLLDHLGVNEPVVIAGGAVGGAIAIHFAATYPQRTAALVPMSPAVSLPPERKQGARDRADTIEREGMRPSLDARLDNSHPKRIFADPARFDEIRLRRLAASATGLASLTRMLADLDLTKEFSRIKCPTLVIAGRYDGDRPPAGSEAVAAQIPGATCVTLETGHFMALHVPEQVAAEIRGLLRRHGIA
jgi:pimeloyl-ACP methyl ester carboxylesterase